MSDAELKLRLIRLLDQLDRERLEELIYWFSQHGVEQVQEPEPLSNLETGYKAMSEDKQREEDAFDWIEGTLHSDDL